MAAQAVGKRVGLCTTQAEIGSPEECKAADQITAGRKSAGRAGYRARVPTTGRKADRGKCHSRASESHGILLRTARPRFARLKVVPIVAVERRPAAVLLPSD